MPSLIVHLAPPEAVAAYIADADPDHHRGTALADYGQWHKVASYEDEPGTDKILEARVFHTECGIDQSERPDRMEETETEPGGERCPKCFGKKGK